MSSNLENMDYEMESPAQVAFNTPIVQRKIDIFNTQSDPPTREFQSSAKTWGQLKDELSAHGINTNGMTSIVGETDTTLDLSSAALPEGEFTLFLMPSKVKSGYEEEDYDEDFDDDYEEEEEEEQYQEPKAAATPTRESLALEAKQLAQELVYFTGRVNALANKIAQLKTEITVDTEKEKANFEKFQRYSSDLFK